MRHNGGVDIWVVGRPVEAIFTFHLGILHLPKKLSEAVNVDVNRRRSDSIALERRVTRRSER
jgi:hypothetical protein